MQNILLYIITAVCTLGIIVLAVMLSALSKKVNSLGENDASKSTEQKLDYLSSTFSKEFSNIRIENQNANKEIRSDVQKSLDNMSLKIENMNKVNYENREKTLELLGSINEKNAEQSEKINKTLVESMNKLQQSNEKKLEEMRTTVDEKLTSTLTQRLNSSFKTVSDQLENLYKSLGEMQKLSTGVTQNVTALNRVLTNVKARGTWAEVQLEGILDQTIPNMYEKNVATVPGSMARVEFAIRIPASEKNEKDVYLPVDSKFPMEDYIRLCDAADIADANALAEARKALETRVLQEAKDVSKYIHVPDTTPFAILYLATEGLYAEIASSRSGLPEKIQSEYNIMIAGPSTITALLNSLSMGFKTVAINEKANEVRQLLSAIRGQYEKFDGLLEAAKKKIDAAGKSIETAQFRNVQINKKLKKVESLESDESDAVLGLDSALFDDDDE